MNSTTVAGAKARHPKNDSKALAMKYYGRGEDEVWVLAKVDAKKPRVRHSTNSTRLPCTRAGTTIILSRWKWISTNVVFGQKRSFRLSASQSRSSSESPTWQSSSWTSHLCELYCTVLVRYRYHCARILKLSKMNLPKFGGSRILGHPISWRL